MKIKSSELTGPALDWAVAKCEGASLDTLESYIDGMREADDGNYSTDWAQGGPIIEREKITLKCEASAGEELWFAEKWPDYSKPSSGWGRGFSPLIAAMRCYVDSKIGDEVDIPDELMKE